MTLLIVIAVCLALLGTFLQVRDWYVARQRLMADCVHRWVYFSAWREGYSWDRRCLDCPLHEPVAREDVPEEWRRRERLAGAGGPSARREGRPGRIRWPRDSEAWCDPVAGSARGACCGAATVGTRPAMGASVASRTRIEAAVGRGQSDTPPRLLPAARAPGGQRQGGERHP